MSLLTVTKRSSDTPTEYYVYYNTWNGEILRISTNLEEDTQDPHVVTKDVADNSIVAGNPAKVLRENIELREFGKYMDSDEIEAECKRKIAAQS